MNLGEIQTPNMLSADFLYVSHARILQFCLFTLLQKRIEHLLGYFITPIITMLQSQSGVTTEHNLELLIIGVCFW